MKAKKPTQTERRGFIKSLGSATAAIAAGADSGYVSRTAAAAATTTGASTPTESSTTTRIKVRPYARRGPLVYGNTNRLLKNKTWDIELSKTGYINEAGRCLVMHTEFEGTPTVLVLLNSYGKLTPFGDANRVRKWIEKGVDRHQSKSASTDSESPAETG